MSETTNNRIVLALDNAIRRYYHHARKHGDSPQDIMREVAKVVESCIYMSECWADLKAAGLTTKLEDTQ